MAQIDDQIHNVEIEIVQQRTIKNDATARISYLTNEINIAQNKINEYNNETAGARRHRDAIKAQKAWILLFWNERDVKTSIVNTATAALTLLEGADGNGGTLKNLRAQKQIELNAKQAVVSGAPGAVLAAQKLASANAASKAAIDLATIQGKNANKKYWIIGGVVLFVVLIVAILLMFKR